MKGDSMFQDFTSSLLWVLVTVFRVFLLLLVELIATMLVYMYLNFYHIETFGYLVRLARSLLDAIGGQVDYWLPGSANSAYATLIGEMGPKSFLLLTFGLVVAAIIRSLVHFGVTVVRRRHLAPGAW
jgi:hypothetical protein